MTPVELAAARQARFQSSMGGLVMDNRFGDFIENLRMEREMVIRNLIDSNVVANTHATAAAIGELSCYTAIMDTYEGFKNRTAADESSESPTD